MSRPQCFSNPALTLWLAVAALLIFVFLSGWFVWQLRPSRVLEKRQASLIEGIEKRSASRIGRLVSDDYSDRWGFTREDSIEAILDVGSQFFSLVLFSKNQQISVDGDWAVIRVHLELSGKPVGPAGNEATRRLNRLESPFEFTWKKQSFLPTSWELVMIENAELPDDLYGYEPGDIRRALNGQ